MKTDNPTTRLIFNGIYGSLSWLLPLVLGFFSTPIIVRGLGNENYGIYALIIGFIGYSFNFGIGRAVTKYVAEFRSQNKIDAAGEVLTATYYLSIFLALTANLTIVFFADSIVKNILRIGAERQTVAVYALYISGAAVFVLLLSQIYQALIQAAHRFDRLALIVNINGVLLASGNIALVLLGFGVLALIWWFLLVTAIGCVLFFVSSKKFLPEIKSGFGFKTEYISLIGKFGLGIFGYQIFGNVILLFERGWIIRTLGEEALTFYVVPMLLGIYLLGFTVSLVQVTFPVISEIQNEPEKVKKLYQKSNKIIVSMIVFSVMTLICGGKLLLSLWISPEFAENSYSILIFHSLTFGILSLFIICWQLTEGFGFPRLNAFISFIWVIVSLPAMMYLTEGYGNDGIAFARFLGIFLTFPFIFYAEKRFLGAVQTRFWIRLIVILTAAIAVSALFQTLVFNFFSASWLTLAAGTILGVFTFGFVLLNLGFVETEEKLMIREMFGGMDSKLERYWLHTVRLYTYYFPLRRGKHRVFRFALNRCKNLPSEIIVETRDGRRIAAHLATKMQDTVFFLGEYERTLTSVFEKLVRKSDVCLDVGANFGWYTTLFHKLGAKEVHAFEPVPPIFDELLQNIELAGNPPNIHPNNFALGDQTGKIELHVFEDLPSGHSSISTLGKAKSIKYETEIKTLDEYLENNNIEEVAVAKIDIEGAEMMFFRGAEKLFRQSKPPILIVEMALMNLKHFGLKPNDLIQFIKERNSYEFFALNELSGKLRRIEGFSDEDLGANVVCLPRDCYIERRKGLKFE